jgi:hypothetical protein
MENLTEKKENLQETKEFLQANFPKEAFFYWVQALEKQGKICKSESGWLCVELGILA